MNKISKYEEYLNDVYKYMKEYPEWRRGQTMFNTLYIKYPDLASSIRGTPLDTFYDNTRIEDFLIWLKLKLKG